MFTSFRRIRALALCLIPALSSLATAAVIYEPVQYQYGDNVRYYYGGNSPRVFAQGERLQSFYYQSGIVQGPYLSHETSGIGNGYGDVNNSGGVGYLHFGLIGQAPYVYSDAIPYVNASVYGYTEVDARNDAYANVPRYFRMADLVGVRDGAGNVIVPAQGLPRGTIDIHPAHPTTQPASRPSAQPILIIPKRLLDKPLHPNKSVADAR